MMKYFLLPLFCLFGFVFADQPAVETPAGTVSSTHAEYDGNELLLSGQVVLNHGLGKMNAERAALQKQELGKEFPFSFIHLEKEVFVHLKDNSKLFCEKADLDFVTLKGHLFSKENEKVTYSDLLEEKLPLKVLGKTALLEMSKYEGEEKRTTYQIEAITALDAVTVHYNNDFILEAHQAHYRKYAHTAQSEATRTFPGKVIATPQGSNDRCHLHHLGDLIDASRVDLDLLSETVTFEQPVGRLVSSLVPHPQNSEVQFSADSLKWEQTKNRLTLSHDVHVQDSALGMLDTSDEVQLIQEKIEDKTAVKNILCKGKTRLEYQTIGTTSPQVLMCWSTLFIDRDKLHGTLTSPEIGGVVPEEKQIYYEEARLSAFANQAHIDYSIVENKLTPVAINLGGNIRLFSHGSDLPKRCSVADRLTYSPNTRTLILSANPGKRVLFWDEEQELALSASEVHITEDVQTKKDVIKGVGNVKCAFTSEESALLHEVFPFYKKQEAPFHETID